MHIGTGKEKLTSTLQTVKPDLRRYVNIVRQLKSKIRERQILLDEKKATPAIQVFRHWELVQKIAGLTEDIEELKSEKALLLNQFNCVDDHGMAEVKKHIASIESSLEKLNQQETKYSDELEAALAKFSELCQQAFGFNAAELTEARQAIRPDKDRDAVQQLQAIYVKKFDSRTLAQSRKNVAEMLDEPAESVSIRQTVQQLQRQQNRQSHGKEHSQER